MSNGNLLDDWEPSLPQFEDLPTATITASPKTFTIPKVEKIEAERIAEHGISYETPLYSKNPRRIIVVSKSRYDFILVFTLSYLFIIYICESRVLIDFSENEADIDSEFSSEGGSEPASLGNSGENVSDSWDHSLEEEPPKSPKEDPKINSNPQGMDAKR